MKKRNVFLVLAVGVAAAVAISADNEQEARRALAAKGMEDIQLVARGTSTFDYTARRGAEACVGSLRVGFFHWMNYDCQPRPAK
jgi:cytochrome c556